MINVFNFFLHDEKIQQSNMKHVICIARYFNIDHLLNECYEIISSNVLKYPSLLQNDK